MAAYIIVVGHGPELEREEGAVTLLRALGAQVRLRAGERRFVGFAMAAQSFASSNDPRAHFGLGAVEAIDEIEVLWPDGSRERFPTWRSSRRTSPSVTSTMSARLKLFVPRVTPAPSERSMRSMAAASGAPSSVPPPGRRRMPPGARSHRTGSHRIRAPGPRRAGTAGRGCHARIGKRRR